MTVLAGRARICWRSTRISVIIVCRTSTLIRMRC